MFEPDDFDVFSSGNPTISARTRQLLGKLLALRLPVPDTLSLVVSKALDRLGLSEKSDTPAQAAQILVRPYSAGSTIGTVKRYTRSQRLGSADRYSTFPRP